MTDILSKKPKNFWYIVIYVVWKKNFWSLDWHINPRWPAGKITFYNFSEKILSAKSHIYFLQDPSNLI